VEGMNEKTVLFDASENAWALIIHAVLIQHGNLTIGPDAYQEAEAKMNMPDRFFIMVDVDPDDPMNVLVRYDAEGWAMRDEDNNDQEQDNVAEPEH
jgi:hypothetical protein